MPTTPHTTRKTSDMVTQIHGAIWAEDVLQAVVPQAEVAERRAGLVFATDFGGAVRSPAGVQEPERGAI
jgi:hypothetical protein